MKTIMIFKINALIYIKIFLYNILIMSFYPENLSNEFNSFIVNLNEVFPNNEYILVLSNETAEQKIQRIQRLSKSLSATVNFNNFCKSKIKVFSHKENDTHIISESMFGSQLSLKKIFNNQSDDVKEKLWLNLHKMLKIYLEQEYQVSPNKQLDERLGKLKDCLINKVLKLDQTKKSIQNIFKTDKLNETTNNMINDIFKSFEGAMTGKNTMENILNLSSELTQKYEDKINNGEIDFNGLLESLKTNVPGMENMKNIIDPLLKMNNFGETEKSVEPVVIDENFSTSNVQMGTLDDTKEEPMLGNILKMANNSGLLNMLNGGEGGLANMLSGEDAQNFTKLFNVVNKLKETGLDNREEINNIFKNDLGLDVDKINQEMATLMNNTQN